MRSAETALEAAHNRLRILGRSEEQIKKFQETRQSSAETPISSPIAGTVVQRKIGPGQFISSSASDPVFVIGDLSTVWLTAFVRESEAADITVGRQRLDNLSTAARAGRLACTLGTNDDAAALVREHAVARIDRNLAADRNWNLSPVRM
jgi:hypothetical protein